MLVKINVSGFYESAQWVKSWKALSEPILRARIDIMIIYVMFDVMFYSGCLVCSWTALLFYKITEDTAQGFKNICAKRFHKTNIRFIRHYFRIRSFKCE